MTNKRRRNKQGLERVLTLAREAAQAAFVEHVQAFADGSPDNGDSCAKCSYYRGIVDGLEHALNVREVFAIEEEKVTTVQQRLVINA